MLILRYKVAEQHFGFHSGALSSTRFNFKVTPSSAAIHRPNTRCKFCGGILALYEVKICNSMQIIVM